MRKARTNSGIDNRHNHAGAGDTSSVQAADVGQRIVQQIRIRSCRGKLLDRVSSKRLERIRRGFVNDAAASEVPSARWIDGFRKSD
jgi:hypothetical protein